jgi:flagellar hook assembly protein FlgD
VYDGGFESAASNTVNVGHLDAGAPVVAATALLGNYPNPFNPTTEISFSLKQAADVQIDVFNIKGEKVKTLVNEHMTAAAHTVTWNGNDDEGNAVTSGVYFYKMQSGKYTSTKKMILMK